MMCLEHNFHGQVSMYRESQLPTRLFSGMDQAMLRIALLRGLAVVAFFAAAWLAPLQAMAAIVPICDGDAVSAWGPVVQSVRTTETNPAEDCHSAAASSDEHDPQVAAMCDAHAATVVAPGRIHPMSDARIDAVVSCDGIHHGPYASAPGSSEFINGLSWANVEPATLITSLMVRPRIYFELPPMFVDAGSPCIGFDREVYHPPRA
jgi:hypothetical protein